MAGGLIRQQDIEELRERADIVEVISDHVQLKKAGRYLKGLCPFHDEKTPSFHVDPVKQLFHCFGCGEGGNVYGFLMKKEGLDFREAVERLAQRYGYRLHYQGSDGESRRREGRRERLLSLHRLAVESYAEQLRGQGGERAREYLRERGMGEEAWREFRLGYAPDRWDFLYRLAVQKGFEPREIAESGLFVRGERGFYDRFRDRVIFPIEDFRGEVVGLGGRVIGAGEPKYLNSPETPLYIKGKNLYNLHRARREIMNEGCAVIVEGYTDVIFLWQAGIRNVVATLGTALSEEHFRILSRLTEKVVLSFDADAAGLDASSRSLAFLESFNLDIRVVLIPGEKDPADFVREAGREGFLRLIEESVGLLEFSIDKTLSAYDPRDIESKKRGIKKSIDVLLNLNAELVAEELLGRIAAWAGVERSRVVEYYGRRLKERSSGAPMRRADEGPRVISGEAAAARQLLRLILRHPWLVDAFVSQLDEELFAGSGYERIIKSLLELYSEDRLPGAEEGEMGEEDRSGLLHELMGRLEEGEAQRAVASLVMGGVEVEDGEPDPRRLLEQAEDLLNALRYFLLTRRIDELRRECERLVSSPVRDHQREQRVSQELSELQRMRNELKKMRESLKERR